MCSEQKNILVTYTSEGKKILLEGRHTFVPKTAQQQLEGIGLSDDRSIKQTDVYVDAQPQFLQALQTCLDPSARHWEDIEPPWRGEWLRERVKETPDQSFQEYVDSTPKRPEQIRRAIYLLPLCEHDDLRKPAYPLGPWPSFQFLQSAVEHFFRPLPVRVLPTVLMNELRPRPIVRDSRGFGEQWHAGDVLKALHAVLPSDAFGLLGATMSDLFDTNTKFVEGLAHTSLRVAVLSFVRHIPHNHCRGDAWEGAHLLYCSLKTTLHEICHMFGLMHCTWYNCLMRGRHANGAEHQPNYLHLCPVCLRKLHWNVDFDIRSRYANLLEVYQGREREHEWFLMDCHFLRNRLAALQDLPVDATGTSVPLETIRLNQHPGSLQTLPSEPEASLGPLEGRVSQRRAGRVAPCNNSPAMDARRARMRSGAG